MQQVALQWLIYQLTNSAFLLGLIGAIGSLPMVLFSIPGGVAADRLEKRRIILVTQSTAMLLAFILAALTGAHWIRPWQIALIAVCGGSVMAFDMPARQAFIVDMVGKEDLMNAIALNSSIFNSARIIGPVIAGVLLASVGAVWCFFANGLSFLAVIAGLLLMRIPYVLREKRKTGMWEDALGGFSYLRTNRTVLRIALLLGVFSIFGWSYAVLMPIFARDVLHSGARGFGILMTCNGIGALIGALTVASLSAYPRRGRLFLGGAFVLAVSLAGFSLSRSFILSAVLLAFAGLGGITMMATANTMIQLSVPDEVRGRIMGVWALVFAGSTPLSNFLAGTSAHYLGAPTTVGINAAATGLIVLGAIIFAHRERNAGGNPPAAASSGA